MSDLKTIILDAITDGYTLPTLDTVDRESGDRIRTYLFDADGLNALLTTVRKRESMVSINTVMEMIYREVRRATEAHDEDLVLWHMIRYGALSELLHELQRKRGADSSEPLVKFTSE